MNKATALFFCIAFFSYSHSQDRTVRELLIVSTRPIQSLDSNGWKLNGTFILNMNQGALSNWASGGEENVLGVNSIFNYAVHFRHNKLHGITMQILQSDFKMPPALESSGKLMIGSM